MIDLFNLFMFGLVGAYLIVMIYIIGLAIWEWISEPFKTAHKLEQQLNEIKNNN